MSLRTTLGTWLLEPESRHSESGMYDDGGTTTSPAQYIINYIGPSGTATDVDEWVAEGMPAVYACVHAISETVGQLPLKLYHKTNAGREVADTHPLYVILHDLPNPEMTAYQFRELLTRHLAMWGRAYAFVERDRDGEVIALWPIHPTRVTVDRNALNVKRYKVKMGDGAAPKEFLFNADKPPILHLHMNSNDGLDGRSPIWINRESLAVTRAADDFIRAHFDNGAVPGVILRHKGKLTERAKDNLKRAWYEKFGGAKNRNKVGVVEEGVEVEVVDINPQKSQLTELRDEQIAAAARIWRVPAFVIQNHTKDTSWGSGIAQMMIGWINTGLMPYFEQWQQAITRDLLSRKTYRTHYAKFVTAALERGDLKSQMDAFAVARQNTVLNANEIRAKLEENHIEGEAGEAYLIPSGTQVLGKDGKPVDQTPEPTPALEPDPEPTPKEKVN